MRLRSTRLVQIYTSAENDSARSHRVGLSITYAAFMAFMLISDVNSNSIFVIATLVYATSLYLKSVTASVFAALLTLVAISIGTSLLREVFGFSFTIFWSVPSLLLTFAIASFFLQKVTGIRVDGKTDFLATSLSIAVFALVWDDQLRRSGGAIAAIYANEDNAAWILTVQRALRPDTYVEGWDYGAFLDTFLYLTHQMSQEFFSGLNQIDHLAMSVVLAMILILCALPFIAAIALIHLEDAKSIFFPTLVLSIAMIFGFRLLVSIGHFSTAIAFAFLTLYLVLSFKLFDPQDNRPRKWITVFLQIATAFLAGITWWPIAPLACVFITISLWSFIKMREFSKTEKIALMIFSGLLIGKLVYRELYSRFDFFSASGEGYISGATSLLGMEGGTVSADPISLELLSILSLLVISLMLMIRIPINAGIVSLAVMAIYASSVKLFNVFLFDGNINYGSRKIELVFILCGFALMVCAITIITGNSFDQKSQASIIATFATLTVILSPGLGSIVGGKFFSGFDSEFNRQVAQSISNNVVPGQSTVCLNQVYQADPMSELRLAAYACSRWVSAYAYIDNGKYNEWRKAVLGQIPLNDLRAVSENLPTKTFVILVGPDNSNSSEVNPEFALLVKSNWVVVR